MKIKCYGPEVLNKNNLEYLLKNNLVKNKNQKLFGDISIKIILIMIMTAIITGGLSFVNNNTSIKISESILNLSFSVMITMMYITLLAILVERIVYFSKKNHETKEYDNLEFPTLATEIIYLENEGEQDDFFCKNKNGWVNKIRYFNFILEDLLNGCNNKIYIMIREKYYLSGKLLTYKTYDNDVFVLWELIVELPSKYGKRKSNLFAIIEKNDLEKFKLIEKDN
jgi:hypothetical protein